MYGLFLRALQGYVLTTFGHMPWQRVLQAGNLPSAGFEPLLHYDISDFRRVLALVSAELQRPAPAILEDLGTSIIAGQHGGAPRRLLRFGGAGFSDFLISLEELPDRARLALPDMELPDLTLEEIDAGLFRLSSCSGPPELTEVMIGVLTAMADDYGALVLIQPCSARQGQASCGSAGDARPPDIPPQGPEPGGAALTIRLLDTRFSEGRRFELSRAG